MNFWQRLKFYGFGFLLGILVLMIILRNKKCSSPHELKMQELYTQTITYDSTIACKLKCLKLEDRKVLIEALKKCKVNYDMSDIHATPFGKYYIDGQNTKEIKYTLVIADEDTLSHIVNVEVGAVPCECK